MSSPAVNRLTLTPNQSAAVLQTVPHGKVPFLDLEGGIRAAKSTAANVKKHLLVTEYPGIHLLHSRWTDEDAHGELLPRWREFAREQGLELVWRPDEQYDEVLGTDDGPSGHNSRVYLRGLRSSESANPYKAIRGLELAWFHVEQAEELPKGYWEELVGRLSQKGYPHGGWLTPQPVNPDHWIAKDIFPEHNPNPQYWYLRTNCYDNRVNLGDEYIQQLEDAYPLGSAKRRTLLEGRRGLATEGEAVYGGYFNRKLHVRESVRFVPSTTLIECWDFGHAHPCVLWLQFLPIGRLQILGAVMGQGMFLEDFVPMTQTYRREWCPNPTQVWGVGDPSALVNNNQGVATTAAAQILSNYGTPMSSDRDANSVERQYNAMQSVAQYMRRLALDGEPAFQVNPRAVLITKDPRGAVTHEVKEFVADGFEAGAIWDTRAIIGVKAGIRRMKNDGLYDHAQRALNYGVIAYEPAQPTQQSLQKLAARELRRAQRDDDPYDRRMRVTTRGRGGY